MIGTESALTRCRLPNQLSFFCINEAECAALYQEIFEQRCWLDHGLRLPEEATVVDVGANIGLSTLFFHHEQPGARVLSVEPAPLPFAALRRNVAMHGMNAACRPVALGAYEHETTLTYYPEVTAMSGLYAEPAADAELTRIYMRNCGFAETDIEQMVPAQYAGVEIPVRVRTLSAEIGALGWDRIDLLKVDAEKSELDVLAGIDPALWARIGQVAVEVHDEAGALDRLTGQLSQRGMTVRVRQEPLLRGTPLYYVAARRAGGD